MTDRRLLIVAVLGLIGCTSARLRAADSKLEEVAYEEPVELGTTAGDTSAGDEGIRELAGELTVELASEEGDACGGHGSCQQPQDAWGGVSSGRIVAGADYLLLRPSFSNQTAMLQNTRSGGIGDFGPFNSSLQAINYDFDHSSGVRAFIGYQLSPDSLVRFSYLDLSARTTAIGSSSGNWVGGNGTIVIGPYNVDALAPGESLQSAMEVDLDVYDLEWARRIDLEGAGCEAPAWDAAWGVGLRFVDSTVASSVYSNVTTVGFPDIQVGTNRSFHGVGPRMAAQLRRYFGASRTVSGFASIGGSLLVGSVDNTTTRLTLDVDRTFESQQVGGTVVVPNIDFSLGGSWQVAERTSLSVGWMLMYFGELGYSEQIDTSAVTPQTPVTSVPLTNSSLSLDGVFFRLSHTF